MPALQWRARYEQLRQQALEQGCGGQGWGLALFLRRGLVAWMRAWPQAPSPARRCEEPRHEEPEQPLRFSAELQEEVISVWVDMVLNQEEEVCA